MTIVGKVHFIELTFVKKLQEKSYNILMERTKHIPHESTI